MNIELFALNQFLFYIQTIEILQVTQKVIFLSQSPVSKLWFSKNVLFLQNVAVYMLNFCKYIF